VEITDINEIEEIIKKAVCCRLGLVDGDKPYIVPLSFGYQRNTLYFHGALEGRKVELIKKNNQVCFEIDSNVEVVKDEEPCHWTMKYKSVIGTGRAFIVENDEEKSRGLSLIVRHYTSGKFTFPKPELDPVLVVRVNIESLSGRQSGY